MNTLARPEDLARYVPSFISKGLIADPSPPAGPHSDPFLAAVLFADISGFTPLSERLTARGAEGVEQLTQVLNAYFGALIEIITAHGGDVFKFAGDALLACWRAATPAGLAEAVQRVAQCGLEILTGIQAVAAPVGERLSLRVGIGAGAAAAVRVGGVRQRWELVLVGQAVNEATRAAAHGRPGAAALGPRACQVLGARGRGAELAPNLFLLESVLEPRTPQPLGRPRPPAEAVPALLAYIPAAIHRRLAARQSGWLAELRRLTVLFVNLPGLGYDTPLATGQGAMQALQEELYRYEGSANKLSVDEKGVTLVAALGLPPLAHEDDELRGVLAGLGMRARLERLGWSTSVGVTSGHVFCGTIGNSDRCEYTIIGDVVNLSARLMQAAHGGILCDEATHRAAAQRLHWEALPPIRVKGKAEPLAVFKPLSPSQPSRGEKVDHPMVGRAAEKQRLGHVLERLAAERAGGVVFLEGEAGIGKSRFVAGLVHLARQVGIPTLAGAADAFERSTPYYAWRPIFRQLLHRERTSADPEEYRRLALQELVADPDVGELAPLLDVVLCLEFGDNARTAAMFGEVRVSSTNDLLVRLLRRRTADTPLQLIMEDAHWLDSASWALARRAAQEVPALLLVLTTRPLSEPIPREYTQLAAAPATERLTLSPLSVEESLALVEHRLGVRRLPEPVAAFLRSRGQGNPFFLQEVAYALRDAGTIQIHDGRCILAPGTDLASLPFPDNVQGVVTSRIDRLAPQEQLTLKVASVVGRTFPHDILEDICPIEEDRFQQAQRLETLVRQELVQRDAPLPAPAYSFKHAITQEVAYQLMAPAQRKLLHQSVAEWYENHHATDLSPFFPLLAKHWSNTGQREKALDYLEKSGRNALREYANEEAVAFFSQALALEGQADAPRDLFRRACWQRQLAEAHYNLDSLGKSLEHFRLALETLGYPFPASGWGMVLSSIWEMAKQVVHRLWPGRFLGRAGAQEARILEAARAYERLAQIRYLNNAKVPTIHAAFRALNLSETVGPCPELARNYANAAVVTGLLLLHGTARAHTRRAQETAEAIAQPSCSAYVAFIRGVYWVTVGEWEEAENDLTRAIEIAERIGERRRWYESTFTLANALSRKGDFRQSAELSRRLHDAGQRRAMPQVQVWGLSWHLWCGLVLEPDHSRWGVLATALSQCLGAHADVPLADQILGHGLLALARWRRGESELARKAVETAEQIIVQTNQISHYLLPAYAGLAEVCMELGAASLGEPARQRAMRRRARRLCGVLGQFSLMYPVGRPRALLVRGQYHALCGRPRRARRAWNKSLAAAERLRMPYEQAQAHAALGRQGPPDDPLRETHLVRARELYAHLGIAGNP